MMANLLAIHEATDFSPCELMFGRSIDLPIDLLLGTPDAPEHQPKDQSEYAAKLRNRIERVHECACENVLVESVRPKTAAVQPWRFSLAVQPHTEEGRSPKLQRPRCGP